MGYPGDVREVEKWLSEALSWGLGEAVWAPGLSRLLCPCSLKVEYDKLANEKTEMQRHYVMVRGGEGLVAGWAGVPAGRLS